MVQVQAELRSSVMLRWDLTVDAELHLPSDLGGGVRVPRTALVDSAVSTRH